MPLSSPNLLDVTVRDGGYLINHQYTPEIVAKIARGLFEAGIEYAEISHGCGIGGKMMGLPGRVDDEELMEAAKKAAPELKLSAFISQNEYSLPLIPALIDFFEMGRVGVNVDEVASTEKIINKLKKYNKTVSLQLVRTHARPPDFAAEAAKRAEGMGVDIVYVVDTFGSFTPEEVRKYISAIQSEVKILVGFHGHNHIKMAIPNTLTAWESGATWLDGSLFGVGRDAGNTVLEILVQMVQSKGFKKEINLRKLCQTTEDIVLSTFQFPTYSDLADLLSSQYKIDYSHKRLLTLIANYLHLPLEEFINRIKNKMGKAVQVTDKHIKAVVKESGHDFDQLVASLNAN
jgi:4-hydroxy-2-oxovalerate aldolase